MGASEEKSGHRCAHAGEPPIRRVLHRHARGRGDCCRHDTDRAADPARQLRVHRLDRGRSGFAQPKYLIAFGAVVVAYGMYMLTSLSATSTFDYFALSRMVLGVGLPFIFIPITVASYDGIAAGKTDQASALINLARNFGGSIGVSLSQTVLAQREQFHQSRLGEHVGVWNPIYGQTLSGAHRGREGAGNRSRA